MDEKIIEIRYISCTNQLQMCRKKTLGGSRVRFICDMLDMYDVYAPAWGGVLENIKMWRVLYVKVFIIYKKEMGDEIKLILLSDFLLKHKLLHNNEQKVTINYE